MPNSLPQAIREYVYESQRNIHTSIPGKIKSFDSDKCTATIETSGKFRKADGTYIDYPDITEVPVCLIQSSGQNCGMAYPIKEGDGVMVMFSEQQLDQWRDDEEPDTELRHDLTSGMAICGLCPDGNKNMQGACDDDSVVLFNGDNAKITVKSDDIKIEVQGAEIEIDSDGNVKIKANSKVQIEAPNNLEVTAPRAEFSGIVKAADFETLPIHGTFNTHTHVPSVAPPTPV